MGQGTWDKGLTTFCFVNLLNNYFFARNQMMFKNPLLLLSCVLLMCLCLPVQAQIREYQWTKTHSWKGYGTACTEKISITGEKWRIKFKTADQGHLGVTIHTGTPAEDKTVLRYEQGRGYGQRNLDMLSGEFFLEIAGDRGEWLVEVEQYFDSRQEWRFLRSKDTEKPMEKFGVWAGEDNAEIEIEILSVPCLLQTRAATNGLLEFQLFDPQEIRIFETRTLNTTDRPQTWIYKPGTYRLKVTTSAVPWKAELFVKR